MVGLDPGRPASEETAANLGQALPVTIEGLDIGAWVAWCIAGLPLFAKQLPTLREIKAAAGRVVLGVAMMRSGGSVSGASATLRTSRKVLRDNLRRAGLYPWPPPAHGEKPAER